MEAAGGIFEGDQPEKRKTHWLTGVIRGWEEQDSGDGKKYESISPERGNRVLVMDKEIDRNRRKCENKWE